VTVPIVDRLSELVSIPSITGSEREIQTVMARMMEEIGLSVEHLEPDLAAIRDDPGFPGFEMPREDLPVVVGRFDTGLPGPKVMLSGHVDVVPPGALGAWTNPPFEPVVGDGFLLGRGSCDMKGGLVSILEAARAVVESGADLCGELIVLTVPSEEDGGSGTLAAVRSGVTADLAVIAEPTDCKIVVAHAGAITFTLEIPGKAAHAATRTEGVSALDKLVLILEALSADEEARNTSESDPLMKELGLPYPTIIGKVSGGEWASNVLDLLVVEGRYGVRVDQSATQAAADLERALGEVWASDPFLSGHPMRLELTGARFEPSRLSPDHVLPVTLAAAARRVTGAEPPRVGAPYGADMRLLVDAGIPCVMYGPGDIRVAHAADENVSLTDVEVCARVLTDWICETLSR